MNKRLILICLFFLLFSLQCKARKFEQKDFPNLLNIQVGNLIQPQGFCFSDLGNWHGYGLNNPTNLNEIGGFRGPSFIVNKDSGLQWLSDCFERISLKDETNQTIPYIGLSSKYLPGILIQKLKMNGLIVRMKEIAVTNRSSMIEYEITNESNHARSFTVHFAGRITHKEASIFEMDKGTLFVKMPNENNYFFLSLPTLCTEISYHLDGYEAKTQRCKLRPRGTLKLYSFSSFFPLTEKKEAVMIHQQTKFKNGEKYLEENKKRWESYLNSLLAKPTDYLKLKRNRDWAIKSLMTLNTNWRSAAGDLKHGGVVPATGLFDAFWAWDSWEHAAALSLFNPELAKDQMRTMFDYQTPEGMIIDLISLNAKENNPLCSKPPIASWAMYMVYQRTKDVSFLKEMLPKLLKFHEWRYKYRDHDQNGLCEYGGVEPETYCGQWESGMDVAVKFEGVKMLKNADGAYSFDQESIELNCYLCAEKFYLAYLMEVVGNKKQASCLREQWKALRKMIQEKFYDKETGYFYDRKLGSGTLVKVMDVSGWIPLFTKVATQEQAEAVKKNMLNPELFGSYFPFSSLNHQHPLYHPSKGYFRGQTWMNYVYFGIRGFKNYGYEKEAQKYTFQIPEKLKGISDKGFPIRENYHSESGEGLCGMHFSWSSAFSLLLLIEDRDLFPYVP